MPRLRKNMMRWSCTRPLETTPTELLLKLGSSTIAVFFQFSSGRVYGRSGIYKLPISDSTKSYKKVSLKRRPSKKRLAAAKKAYQKKVDLYNKVLKQKEEIRLLEEKQKREKEEKEAREKEENDEADQLQDDNKNLLDITDKDSKLTGDLEITNIGKETDENKDKTNGNIKQNIISGT